MLEYLICLYTLGYLLAGFIVLGYAISNDWGIEDTIGGMLKAGLLSWAYIVIISINYIKSLRNK